MSREKNQKMQEDFEKKARDLLKKRELRLSKVEKNKKSFYSELHAKA